MKANILICDDDRTIVDLIKPVLTRAGYKVTAVDDADGAMAALRSEQIDLLLLDIELPGISGMSLLDLLKRDPRTELLPVMMITGKKAESSKVQGLHTGADDYLVKPFSTAELTARVEAILRRTHRAGKIELSLSAAGISVNVEKHLVEVNGKKVDLSPAEFDFLALMMRRPGYVMTYNMISEALSQGSKILTSENLYGHVKNIRRKLGKAGDAIETVHGIGYRFTA